MEVFDIAIIGAGVSGSLLLHELLQSRLKDSKILLIDPSPKDVNDRIISFWSQEEFPLRGIQFHSWDMIKICTDNLPEERGISPYKYFSFDSIHLYDYVRTLVESHPFVERSFETVKSISDDDGYVVVTTTNSQYKVHTVFDGRRKLGKIREKTGDHTLLFQEFTGLKVHVDEPQFDVSAPMLFDFRTDQSKCFSFCYLIPYSAHEAVVDLVTYTTSLNKDTKERLEEYIKNVLGISQYTVTLHEAGLIPLTDYQFPRRTSKNVYAIGTNGGMVKPSTGFGFTRMLRDSRAIASQLAERKRDLSFASSSLFLRACDTLLLNAIKRDHATAHLIFNKMFKRPDASHILRFLDEDGTVQDILKLGYDLPKFRMFREITNVRL